jgi:hypothetical protein
MNDVRFAGSILDEQAGRLTFNFDVGDLPALQAEARELARQAVEAEKRQLSPAITPADAQRLDGEVTGYTQAETWHEQQLAAAQAEFRDAEVARRNLSWASAEGDKHHATDRLTAARAEVASWTAQLDRARATTAAARQRAEQARQMLASGYDPTVEAVRRAADRLKSIAGAAAFNLFAAPAQQEQLRTAVLNKLAAEAARTLGAEVF